MKKFNIVVTAGGTSEKIDNVRKITNSSTGKLGVHIAQEMLKRENIENIYYVCSKESLKPMDPRIKIIIIDGVRDLLEKVRDLLEEEQIDIFVHSMAVSDYYVDYVTTRSNIMEEVETSGKSLEEVLKQPLLKFQERKISSDVDGLILALKRAPKVISIIKETSPKTFLVGFKLLDGVSKEELIQVGRKLMAKNNCDLVVANDLNEIRQGVHHAYIIDKNHDIDEVLEKEAIAKRLVKKIFD